MSEDGRLHYHDHRDFELLSDLAELARPEFEGFLGLNNALARRTGRISWKHRELMAVAVACAMQCAYCVDLHTANAKKAGASREELAEAVFVAAAVQSEGAVTHGTLALKLFDSAPAHADG